VAGQVQGTVSGNTLTANFVVPANDTSTIPATGTYTGSLTLNSNAMTGSVSGSQSTGGTVTATVNLTQSR
jgi:hypothetical protein